MPLDRDWIVLSLDVSSDGSEVSWKNSTITVRSNRDRGTIEPRSGSFGGGIASRKSDADRRTTKKTCGPLQSAGFPSNGGGTSWKNSTITARSSCHRGVIELRSRRDRATIEEILAGDRRGFISNRSVGDRQSTSITIDARSRPDHGAIVAKIAAEIGVCLRLI